MLDWFDCNVTLGKVKTPAPGGVLDAARAVSELDRYGIREALVTHAFALRHAPAEGNVLATEAAAQSDRLHACWYVLPPGTDEIPPLDERQGQMRAGGVRCLRIAPDANGHMFSLAEVVCGEMFAWLERTRVPLFVEQAALAWRDLDDIVERHPALRLVLLDVNYRINRDLYPRLKAYEHLYVETSGLQQQCGLQDICERFGAERLLFGSRMPLLCAGAAMHLVEKAAIPEVAQAAIAGGNLRRLLGEADL